LLGEVPSLVVRLFVVYIFPKLLSEDVIEPMQITRRPTAVELRENGKNYENQ
jgi:hypothetical protein